MKTPTAGNSSGRSRGERLIHTVVVVVMFFGLCVAFPARAEVPELIERETALSVGDIGQFAIPPTAVQQQNPTARRFCSG